MKLKKRSLVGPQSSELKKKVYDRKWMRGKNLFEAWRMRLSECTTADPSVKAHKGQKKIQCMGKAQKEMAQKRSMFIQCLLYSHTHNSVFCFVLAHCYQVQIFHIFLLKCLLSLHSSHNYLSSLRLFAVFVLQHALHPSQCHGTLFIT